MILTILTDVMIAVCLLGAVFLFLRGKNNKARRMLGYTLLMWGLCSVARVVCLNMGLLHLLLHPLRPVGLVGGGIFVVFMLYFPLEVMLPGWLNLKRLFMLFLPVVAIALIYKLLLFVTGQETEEFDSFSSCLDSLTHANVWFRLIMLLMVSSYIIFLLRLIYKNEKKYLQWKNENYADAEYMDISWMRFYAYGTALIFIGWILNVFIAREWTFILHSAVTILSFSYFIYKGLFYESAYPEDFFKDSEVNPIISAFQTSESTRPEVPGIVEEVENISFESRMPQYVETFKTWMDKEKPYLYKDFKLTDVARVLPLNRSYLSRVLNEGLGMNFCQVVRKYRVDASKDLLKNSPDMPIYLVAERCGFSSDTTFIRAFQQEMNMTPSRYRVEEQPQQEQ